MTESQKPINECVINSGQVSEVKDKTKNTNTNMHAEAHNHIRHIFSGNEVEENQLLDLSLSLSVAQGSLPPRCTPHSPSRQNTPKTMEQESWYYNTGIKSIHLFSDA